MRPPKRIRMGAYRWTVVLLPVEKFDSKDGTDKVIGETDQHQLVIRLAGKLHPQNLRETLQHELLHAAWWSCGFTSEALIDEERTITHLSPLLLQVWQDNPRLVEYLAS